MRVRIVRVHTRARKTVYASVVVSNIFLKHLRDSMRRFFGTSMPLHQRMNVYNQPHTVLVCHPPAMTFRFDEFVMI